MDPRVGGTQTRTSLSYEEFEPLCTWQREDSQDILVIHLQDFKKEQLRIQISNSGVMKITGESTPEGKKRSRFAKEVKITKDYDSSNIHAKFSQGRLRITLPKKPFKPFVPDPTVVTPSPQEDKKVETPSPQEDQNDSANANAETDITDSKSRVGQVLKSKNITDSKSRVGQVLRSKMCTQVMVNVGFVAFVAFSAYTAYKYWTSYVQVDED